MLFSVVFTGFLLVACISDLKAFRIPNAVPLALMALFLIKVAATAGIAVWPEHLVAFGMMALLGLVAFGFGVIGGGDAKLMIAVALWIGMSALSSFLVLTAVGGGALALLLLGLRHLANDQEVLPSSRVALPGARLLDRKAPIPYALPIASAALWLEWS